MFEACTAQSTSKRISISRHHGQKPHGRREESGEDVRGVMDADVDAREADQEYHDHSGDRDAGLWGRAVDARCDDPCERAVEAKSGDGMPAREAKTLDGPVIYQGRR